MAHSKNYEDLVVWKKSIALSKNIYLVTASFPKEEQYGLTAQIRRSSVSIPSNIAEGCSKSSSKDFLRFLDIAVGSAAELHTQLLIAHEIALLTKADFDGINEQTKEISRMLHGLRASIKE